MSGKVALIAGLSGTVGAALARVLAGTADWKVYGISRGVPRLQPNNVVHLQADLKQPDACESALTYLSDLTHIFYCGRATHAEQTIEAPKENLRLLSNLVDAAEKRCPKLQHVHLVQGGKYYGVHLGPFPTPARESDKRPAIENFNFDQQDFLADRARSAKWSWSASRPNTLLHYSPLNNRNLVSTLGAYAAVCRELGSALDFPGNQGAYDSITQVTTLDLLCSGIRWVSTQPQCANEAYNFTNTDVFRWRDLWPVLAEAFDMPVGSVRPLRLAEVMANRDSIWRQILESRSIQSLNINNVANWAYADATLERYWDEILCHNKTRAAGFEEWDDSKARFSRVLLQYRDAGLLPG